MAARQRRFVAVGEPYPDKSGANGEDALQELATSGGIPVVQRKRGRGRPAGGLAATKAKPGPRPRSGPPPFRSITVEQLIHRGVLQVGSAVRVMHRDQSAEGVLNADGSVTAGDESFQTCGDFATAVKRRTQPNARADDGWRTCTVNGRSLHDYRTDVAET